MRELNVVSGRPARPIRGDLAIRINGQDATFRLATEKLATRLIAPIESRHLDLLEIAATVFEADARTGRGMGTRQMFGAAWYRRFHYTIAVRAPEFWSQPTVTEALTEAVSFLQGEDVRFSFVNSVAAASPREFLDLDPQADGAFKPDRITMFSGGLDSLAGALEVLATTGERIALVTHRSAAKLMPHQEHLVVELKKRFPGRVFWVPVRANLTGREASETTQRSRFLLFAALGFVAARMLNAPKLCFFENGVVSVNLPISSQVIGSMATRTTHPVTLHRFNQVLDLVAGEPFLLENPFAWHTKTDVLGKLAGSDGNDLIAHTVSCTHVRSRSKRNMHCGVCSQCLDRRFAVLAAGLEAYDPAAAYETDVMVGAREKPSSQILALDWTIHGRELAKLTAASIMRRFGEPVVTATEGYPNRLASSVEQDLLLLHRRHGQAINAALARALRLHASAYVDATLPETSLLRMCLNQGNVLMDLPDQATGFRAPDAADDTVEWDQPLPISPEGAQDDATKAHTETRDVLPLQIAVRQTHRGVVIDVHWLGTIKGKHVAVVPALKPTYDDDLAAGLLRRNHRFMPSSWLSVGLGVAPESVPQLVNRCRKQVAGFYKDVVGSAPERPLLIEGRHAGYRLDPDCRFVATSEVAINGRG